MFSNSLSIFKAINHISIKNSYIQNNLEICHEPLENKEVDLSWMPTLMDD